MKKLKSNRSSIIRVIISNFDDKQVKEIKVLYSKQGGVDVIKLKGGQKNKDGKIIFDVEEIYNTLEEKKDLNYEDVSLIEKQNIDIGTNQDKTELYITKRHYITNEIIRKYTLYGRYESVGTGKIKATVSVKDNKEDSHKDKSRSKEQSTNRILLDRDLMNNYKQIAYSDSKIKDENKNIDSQEIYKINKFLTYRSNMIIYYQIINNFLLYNEEKDGKDTIREIWKYFDGEKSVEQNINSIEKGYANISNNINDFILNHNNRVEKDGHGEMININEDKGAIEEDLKKIFKLFTILRHSMVHYNYKFYKKLYSGNDFKLDGQRLSDLLDLNIFKELSKIKGLKDRAVTNYLDRKTKIYVLNKKVNAISLLEIYRDICERKLGFNNFINEIVTTSREGGHLSKSTIIRYKHKEIYYDIHENREYKNLYIKRKKFVSRYSKIIEKGIDDTNKKDITEINRHLEELNKKMKKITNRNARYRLEYKMQLAFGFINKEYNLDINEFLDDFNPDKEEIRDRFINSKEEYLEQRLNKNDNKFNSLMENYNFRELGYLFSNDRENNLFKLYVLMYLLLPNEIRGDFLGYVKKNYYDLKHVNFINRKDKTERDNFFHDLRLFEKNVRKLEILSYNFIDYFLTKDIREKFNKGFKRSLKDIVKDSYNDIIDNMNIADYYKSFVIPIMKNYQIIFKLLNDIELNAIFNISKKRNMNNDFSKAIDSVKKGEYINFSNIIRNILSKNDTRAIFSKIKGGESIRNQISHIGMKGLFLDLFNNEKNTISEKIEKFIDIILQEDLTGKDFNKNIINDYYMKKERLVYNLKLRKEEDLISMERQEKRLEANTILSNSGLNYNNLDLDKLNIEITKIEKKIKEMKKKSKAKSKEIYNVSVLRGILEQNQIMIIKKLALQLIQKDEYRYININIYDRNTKKDYNIELKTKSGLSGLEYKILNKKKPRIEQSRNQRDNKLEEVYIYTQDKKHKIRIKNRNDQDKKLIIEFNKDKKKSIRNINLDYKYIQNIKFMII